MKKILKYVSLLILIIVILFFIVARFSASKSNLQCFGKISDNDTANSTTVYIKMSKYRWWVRLWSDSYGDMNLEIPNTWFDYYGYMQKTGDLISIYDISPQKIFKGNFSTLSNTLYLDTAVGLFNGTCSIMK